MGLTVFELHTHGDIQLGPDWELPSIGSKDEAADTQIDRTDDDDGGSPVPRAGVAALVALVVLVGLVGVAKYFMGELDQEPIELVESDEL